ncbi:c-type cytochrome [Rubritalea tangerina]|uniref:C-type cytochrome n=2 Tax=Rubritalea tangerina TaxID=430798 RepID=A0ABW4ZBJ7_9BACT
MLLSLHVPLGAEDAAEVKGESGLVLEVATAGGKDLRLSKRAALAVGKGESPSALLAAGKYSATWHGMLNLEKRSRVYFSFEGTGAAELFIDGESVLKEAGEMGEGETERLRLNSGQVPIKVVYTSPEDGAGGFRLMWRGREFSKEPVPASVLVHEKSEPLEKAMLVRRGRALFAELKCSQCHEGGKGMPEAGEMAPSLAGVGSRLDAGWMEAWLKDPKSMRAHARMPQVLKNEEDAQHVAAYLEGLKEAEPAKLAGNKAAGGKLFHDLGCIACHRSESGQDMASWATAPIDLFNAGHKYEEGALVAFLKNPGKHHAATRMPDFALEDKEAADLAAFVRSLSSKEKPSFSNGDAAKGKQIVVESHCSQCHEGVEASSASYQPLAAIAKKGSSDKSCLKKGSAVDYGLNAADSEALNAFLEDAQGVKSLAYFNKAEYAHRQFENLNCASCHQMDTQAAELGAVHQFSAKYAGHSEEENTEEAAHGAIAPPALTYIGEKLTIDYMERLFGGKLEYRTRPWVTQRMPAFPSRDALLAEGFAAAYGLGKEEDRGNAEVEQGKTLFGMVGGFGCAACHGAGEAKPIAVFEAPGVNLQFAGDRLRMDFYHRWMRDPQRIDPQTIMPKYFVDENATTLTEPLEGDGQKQMEAIWNWMQSLNEK